LRAREIGNQVGRSHRIEIGAIDSSIKDFIARVRAIACIKRPPCTTSETSFSVDK